MSRSTFAPRGALPPGRTVFLFDLDGTLVDSVYQHVLDWHEAMTIGRGMIEEVSVYSRPGG